MAHIVLYGADAPGDVVCPACKAELEVDEGEFIPSLKEIVECDMCGHRFCLTVRIRITYQITPIQEC